MPVEVSGSPPERHQPSHSNIRPKGILKNPSFSGQGGAGPDSPTHEATQQQPGHSPPPSAPLDPQEAKELTIQNTLQNAGHRRSSSAARRSSASRRHSSAAGLAATGSSNEEDTDEKMRLKWDEANLYLTEQDRGGRMKITEPKTPFEYGMGSNAMEEEEEEEDVSIDPRFVNVDEVDMAKQKNKGGKKARESDIPGLELGEPEYEGEGAEAENERIVRQSSLSRESSKEKHVALGEEHETERVGMPSLEDEEKHRVFEEQRKRHYEMRNVKDMLGHPEDLDEDEDEDTHMTQDLPRRGVNGRA